MENNYLNPTANDEQTGKKNWSTPNIQIIDKANVQSGNVNLGQEGQHTSLYNGNTFTGIYMS